MLVSNRLDPQSALFKSQGIRRKKKNRKNTSTKTQSASTSNHREHGNCASAQNSNTNPGCRRAKDFETQHHWRSDKNVPPLSKVHVVPGQRYIFRIPPWTHNLSFPISSRSQWARTSGKSSSINHSRPGLNTHMCDSICCLKPACSIALPCAWTDVILQKNAFSRVHCPPYTLHCVATWQ